MGKQIESTEILGVRIDKVTMDQSVAVVMEWLQSNTKHYIVTPNLEFIVAAQKDLEFKRVLNKADLAIPDGAGLRLSSDVKSTVGGVYLLDNLCRDAAKKSFTVGFLGGRNRVAKEASECLQKKYPGLKVVLADDGPEVDMDGNLRGVVGGEGDPWQSFPQTDILFVAFGQMKQEKWISKNLDKLPVKVMMGVGGSFDEIAGRVPMVPQLVHRLGLKWLVRLVLQPWRIKRQLALAKFVWLVVKEKLVI